MTDPDPSQPDPSTGPGITRRHLIAGLGAAGGAAGLLAAFPGNSVVAGPAIPSLGPRPASFPEVLDPPVPGLTYAQIDAYAFFNAETAAPNGRQVDNLTGANPVPSPGTLVTPLPVPSGSTLKQINLSYLGTPAVQIWLRPLADPRNEQSLVNQTLPLHTGSDPRAESIDVDLPVEPGVAYTLRVACTAGTSVFAASIGYEPPAALPDGSLSFLPLEPPTRPLDTRQPGYPLGKLASEEVRTLDLGLPPGARAAVLNLTITGTESNFGYVSVYAAGIPWPGNSSINWSSPELTAANCVITAVDDQGRIAIRGGEASTHVIVDVLGAFVLPAGIEVA